MLLDIINGMINDGLYVYSVDLNKDVMLTILKISNLNYSLLFYDKKTKLSLSLSIIFFIDAKGNHEILNKKDFETLNEHYIYILKTNLRDDLEKQTTKKQNGKLNKL